VAQFGEYAYVRNLPNPSLRSPIAA
jgi:hypothetical protein